MNVHISEDRINFNEDTGKLEITIKEEGDIYRPNIWKQQILSALKLQELVLDMEDNTGRSLVDVQNWLSKEGKQATQVTNKVLRDLIKESETTNHSGDSS